MSANQDDSAPDQSARHRPIRSFVLRQGRQTEAQKRAFELHWPSLGLDYLGQPRDFDAAFGRQAPRVVEIGFGNGEQLLFSCEREPQRDFIGIEVHGPGVGRLLNAAASAGLRNLRIYQHDAVEVLRDEVAPSSLDEVRIYFPDPWHKKRHHKRRLVQPGFVDLLCQRLRPGGLLHVATDWEGYAQHLWEVLDAEPRLRNRAGAGGTMPRPDWRRQTHFETRGLKLGHGVWDLLYDLR
ncbi:MAG TPA: tRNA (guanosine(46)-N7)-methyltransferase TrmB [Arenimonas sp.]|nr:tRNA (guanosine(46)-N7)-methyltransferase TrmB [Arenimonas sp.]